MEENKILQMKNIIKEFNTVRVLKKVNFDLNKGEVHSIVGANGAGKSTLMKILNGILINYEGELILNSEKVQFYNPRDAFKKGIVMIHQELDLVEELDVSENIYLGSELCHNNPLSTIDRRTMRAETQKLLDSLGFPIKSNEIVSQLPIAKKQLVLIARTVAMKAKVIVMDEPTSSLSNKETERLFKVINDLRDRGVSVIYISHFLEEIFRISDRVTVLRDGEKIITIEASNCTQKQLVEWMIGRDYDADKCFKRHNHSDDKILSARGLTRKKGLVKDISFDLNKGEVLGVAGVVGSGRTELARMIFGIDEKSAGEIVMDGQVIEINSPTKAVSLNMAFIPENRKQEGLVLKRTIRDNISIVAIKDHLSFKIINYKALGKIVKDMIEYLRIICSSPNQEVAFLSGGNQQKVVIGKWLSVKPRILILDQPTRGIDVGAKEEIYELINALAKEGTSIIFISDELEELISLSDRIVIMKKGRITEEINNKERNLSKEDLLSPMVS